MDTHHETRVRPAITPTRRESSLHLDRIHPTPQRSVCLDGGVVTIGRDAESSFVEPDLSVSRNHARIDASEGAPRFEDLGSKNGSTINGVRVTGSTALCEGDVVRTGNAVFVVTCRRGGMAAATRDEQSPLVGGASLAQVRQQIRLLGPADLRILITGESGTGKEIVAREMHRASGRPGPFMAVNCAALPESLVEAELFGFVRGAFTGAHRDKAGLFEAAAGGTLFLDEVTEMPYAAQAKLLRVLESRELRRVGSLATVQTDCRVVSATNRDLGQEVERERFRGDLMARLAEVEIRIPPLRRRIEDLPRLIAHLSGRAGRELSLDADAIELLACYRWPLNVRELDNVVRMLEIVAQGQTVGRAMMPPQLITRQDAVSSPRPGAHHSRNEEVLAALRQNGGNVRRTSQQLGLSRTLIYRVLDRAGLTPADLRNGTSHA